MPSARQSMARTSTDPLQGGERGARDGSFFFPQTVVREFQIVHAGATAEVGGTNAGFINMVTKEGSNKYRGEAFYIGRPSALSSPRHLRTLAGQRAERVRRLARRPHQEEPSFFYVGSRAGLSQHSLLDRVCAAGSGVPSSRRRSPHCNSRPSGTAIQRRCSRARTSC